MTDLTLGDTVDTIALPTFDVDESVAALLLHHVRDPVDRSRLSAVSTLWRRVVKSARTSSRALASSSSAAILWPKDVRLVLKGDLAAKLTNSRVMQLLEYAGPHISVIEIHGAPAAFWGLGLQPHFALMSQPRFPDVLQTLDLSGCPGVWGGRVLGLLHNTRIGQRPKAERLDKLSLAGCNVRSSHVPGLDCFVRHSRTSSPEKFDYWVCSGADHVVEKCRRCWFCRKLKCMDCIVMARESLEVTRLPGFFGIHTSISDIFICASCEPRWGDLLQSVIAA